MQETTAFVSSMSSLRNGNLRTSGADSDDFDVILAQSLIQLLLTTNLNVERALTLERNRIFKQKVSDAIVLSKLLSEYSYLSVTISSDASELRKLSDIKHKVDDYGTEFVKLEKYVRYLDASLDLIRNREDEIWKSFNQNQLHLETANQKHECTHMPLPTPKSKLSYQQAVSELVLKTISTSKYQNNNNILLFRYKRSVNTFFISTTASICYLWLILLGYFVRLGQN